MTYNRLFTLHGVIMVWLFMIPAIPAVFGNFLLPIMLGARDLAFPRLNLASFYVYLLGRRASRCGGMIAGGADTGWTFYAPYSDDARRPTVAPVALGVFILGMSSIMTGLNFIVTTHTLRAAACAGCDMPLFVWAIYATSIIHGARDAGARPGARRWSRSITRSSSASSTPRWAAIRCCSSTCSGSTRTRPSTS